MRVLNDSDLRWVAGGHYDTNLGYDDDCGYDENNNWIGHAPDSWTDNVFSSAADFFGLDGSFGYDGNDLQDRQWVWQDIGGTFNAALDTIGTFMGSAFDPFFMDASEHYERNAWNEAHLPENEMDAFDNWTQMPPELSVAHMSEEFGENNRKYVDPTGHYEAVYNDDGLVTSEISKGTYNISDPYTDPVGHFLNDVLPWIFYGNSASDTSTIGQRLGMLNPF